jgi:hypothetical protein
MLFLWRYVHFVKGFKPGTIFVKKHSFCKNSTKLTLSPPNILLFTLKPNVIPVKKTSFYKNSHISYYFLKKNSFFTFHYSTYSPPSGIKQPECNLKNLKYLCSTAQKIQCVYTIKSLSKKALLILWRINIAKIQYICIHTNFCNVNARGRYSSHFSLTLGVPN